MIIENSYNYIDKEINKYFSTIEADMLNNKVKFNKRNISEIINKDEFNKFITSIYENLNIILNDSMENIVLSEIDKIIKFKHNAPLLNEYRNTRLLSEINENIFNELIENTCDYLIYAKILNVDFSNIFISILEIPHISSCFIIEKNKKNIENRLKGNLLNIKCRLKKIFKQQIIDYINLLDIDYEQIA
jgi:hypothetical protein